MARRIPARRADPYRDGAVIDARAPRFNQGTIALVTVIGLVTGAWWLVGVLALQLVVGLLFGRRYCLPCVAYFELVQPRVGEGPLEDARPVRFANIVGAVFLSLSFLSFTFGISAVGTALAVIVAVLASLAAVTGLCVGCEMYRFGARLRGVRPGSVVAVDLDEVDAEISTASAIVQFTHPLCNGCEELEHRLRGDGHAVVTIDISRRPELARAYHVTVVPYAVEVDPNGRVLRRIAG